MTTYRQIRQRCFKPTVLSLAVAAAIPVLGQAQTLSDGPALEEVVVTAARREQSLQDYAGTVQAFSGEKLEKLGITTDFRSLQHAVTGLHISNQEGKLEVYLRGIGSSDSDFASDPSVATHYNDVYLPRPRSLGPMFFDVERVEVNKGPQGTLRGRNATGGTINIISRRPELTEFSGRAMAGIGNENQQQFEGVINIPIGDTFAVRAAYYQEERDTYMENAFVLSPDMLDNLAGQGSRVADAFGDSLEAPGAIDDSALRVSLLWEPNDRFSAYVMADHVEQGGSGTPGAFSGRSLAFGEDIEDLDNPYRQYFVNEGYIENDINGVVGKLVYDFGAVSVEYNGAWREYDFQHRNAAREWQIGMDFAAARDEAEAVILGNEQTAYGNFTQGEISETQIHELRLFANDDQRFRWALGAFYLSEDFSWASQDFNHGWWGDCDWFQDGTVCGWLNGLSSENRNDESEVESTAFYVDGTYDVTERFRVLGGLRYTDDEKTAREANAQYQLVLTDEALTALGLAGPQDIVMGTDGLALTGAGDRPNNTVPLGNSAATRQYFLDGISGWGHADNIDDLIAYNPELFNVVISSDFQRDRDGDGVPDAGSGNIEQRYEESYVDWRIGTEYDFNDDQMLYATISTGTRAGGINRPLPGADSENPVSWDPEELVVYELGSKNTLQWGDIPVRLNGAVFFYDYSDKVLQGLVTVSQPGCDPSAQTCTVNHVQNQNVAEATVLGFEVDSNFALPLGFDLGMNLAYLDAEYDDGAVVIDTRQGGAVEVDISGNQMRNTSKWNFNVVLNQSLALDWGYLSSFDWTLSGNYRSEFYLSPFNSQGFDSNGNEIPLSNMAINNHWLITGAGFPEANGNFLSDEVPASMIWNLNAGINFGGMEQLRVEAWVSNLTDETYSTKAFINDSVNIRFLNTPRLMGMRVMYHF